MNEAAPSNTLRLNQLLAELSEAWREDDTELADSREMTLYREACEFVTAAETLEEARVYAATAELAKELRRRYYVQLGGRQ